MKNTRICSIALLTAMLASQLAACGGSGATSDGTTAASTDETTPAETSFVYPYPETGYGGEEFSFLNIEDLYLMHCELLRDEQTGDVLDDAMYNRNKRIEERFDITFKETLVTETWEFLGAKTEAQKSILAGDDAYDIMFMPIAGTAAMVIDGAFVDLTTLDNLNLSEKWWYSGYNEQMSINGKLYGAMGGAHLAVHDALRILAFNSDMMEDLKLDEPYDLVREGKWTLDAFNEYISTAANLNGADTAGWLKDGKTVYGFSNNQNSIFNFTYGANEQYVILKDNKLSFECGSERFFDVIAKLKTILTTSDAKGINAPNGDDMLPDDGNPGYLYIFTSGRCLFSFAEVNKLQRFRSLDFEYGIVPFPKYDENQQNYVTTSYQGAPAAYIPVTSPDPEKVAYVLDAMAYEGEQMIVPSFREYTVEQKGLRNEDSIEMLQILTDTATPLCYAIFGISGSILDAVGTDVWTGTDDTASAIATSKSSIEEEIKKIMEEWS